MKKIVLIAALCVATMSFANQSSRGGDQREMREPPKEAISACEGQSEGNECSMSTPRGDTLEGTCKNTPDDKYFACMPNNHRSR